MSHVHSRYTKFYLPHAVAEEKVVLHPTGKEALTSLRQLLPSHPFLNSVGTPITLNNGEGKQSPSEIYPASDLLVGLANARVFQSLHEAMSNTMVEFYGMGDHMVLTKKKTAAADGTIETQLGLKVYFCDWCEEVLEKTDHDINGFACCSLCESTRYCNKTCLLKHWPQHKPTCIELRQQAREKRQQQAGQHP